MQFGGHCLPVHQSMSVPWEFFSSSHFISQFPPTRFPHITDIGMCHFLPVHHLEWHFARAEGQNITVRPDQKMKCSFFQATVVSMLLYGCTTWTLNKQLEKKLDGNYTRMLRVILKSPGVKAPTIRPPTSHHENYPS